MAKTVMSNNKGNQVPKFQWPFAGAVLHSGYVGGVVASEFPSNN